MCVRAGMEKQGKKRLSRDQRVSFISPANRSENRKLSLICSTDTSGNHLNSFTCLYPANSHFIRCTSSIACQCKCQPAVRWRVHSGVLGLGAQRNVQSGPLKWDSCELISNSCCDAVGCLVHSLAELPLLTTLVHHTVWQNSDLRLVSRTMTVTSLELNGLSRSQSTRLSGMW